MTLHPTGPRTEEQAAGSAAADATAEPAPAIGPAPAAGPAGSVARAPDTVGPPAAPATGQGRWVVLGVGLVCAFLVIGGVSVVNLAMPSLQRSLQVGFGTAQFVIAGYGLVYAIFLITGGRLGDVLGRKRVLLTGLALFTLAVAVCGIAPNAPVLIGARLVQGFGAALVYPQILSIIQDTFEGRERNFALGLFGATIGVALVAGQLIGGALIQLDLAGLGWRPAFLVLVPIGAAALLAGRRVMAPDRPPGTAHIDHIGTGLLGTALLFLTLPLLIGPGTGWAWWTWAMLGAAPPVLALFMRHEQRLVRAARTPLLRPELFRQRAFSVGMSIGLVFFISTVGLAVYASLTLQAGLGLDPLRAGLAFAPVGVAFFGASLVVPQLVPRLGRSVLTFGYALLTVGLVATWYTVRVQGSGLTAAALAAPLLLVGAGQGFTMSPLIGIVLTGIRPDDKGSASGALTTAFQVGQALGVAGIGTIFSVMGASPGAGADTARYLAAFRTALLVMVALTVLSLLLVALLPGAHGGQRHHHFLWLRHGRRTGLSHAFYLLTGGHAVGRLAHWFHHHDSHKDHDRHHYGLHRTGDHHNRIHHQGK
ncbi:MFS transporter [Streptomyces sp. NBC_01304]|uniref:MFS transporter n=1 Tax=Streptomyces sp. NBC_01304 TaxID=2903818 RepID=UPI002E164113|nr:MFS transporter [Streptomyces sp. NBC_01304]